MAQMGFFDVENRYATLDANNDPLVKINAVVPPAFAGAGSGKRSEAAWSKSGASQPTSVSRTQVANPGTPSSFDRLRMFKAIILCALYNLSDDQVEYQMRDRLSFDRLRRLRCHGPV